MPLRPWIAVALAALLAACATSSVVTGRARPPIDPAQVRIYYTPPAGYEEIARLNTSSGAFTYGEQNKMNSVLAKLRNEAARLGANGVLLVGTDSGYGGGGVNVGGGVGRGGGRTFSSVGVGVDITPRQKYAYGLAIYVANPPPATMQPAPEAAPKPATPTNR